MSLGTIEVNVAKIKSVEPGNVIKDTTSQKVIAFTCDVNGRNVKLILKDKKAEVVYDKFLKDGKSRSSVLVRDGISLDKEVYVSFVANIKEVRQTKNYTEVVCHNPSTLQFTYDFLVL